MEDKDELLEVLRYKLRQANERISILESENHILRNKLDNANMKIRLELEPRIQQEKRSYDCWVKNQGVI